MAEIEIGPLADRLSEDELKELAQKLDKLGAPPLRADADGDSLKVASVDGGILVEFLDRLDAHDLACEIYLPGDFEGRVEVGNYRVGSSTALLEVLEEMKDEMAPDDDEDEDEDEDEDDKDEDEDSEDDDDEDDDYSDLKLLEEKLRRLWKIVYDAANLAIEKNLPLYVLAD
jgi:hypothetical protein